MKNKKFLLILLVLTAIGLLIVGCAKTTKTTKPKKAKPKIKAVGHNLPAKDQQKLAKDIRFDFKTIAETRDDTSQLSLALTNGALTGLSKNISDEAQKGRIKIRRFSNLNITVNNYNKPYAGATVLYRDQSYFISRDTSQAITSPTNEKKRLLLAVSKKGNRWKIAEFLNPAKPTKKPKK